MDIVTRLLLKTNDFDANLNKAKGSVNSFQSGITSMAQTAGAGIMKFAGTLGIAVGAYEGFNKVMNSSQTLSDEYNRTIDGLKGGVDEFFYSIGSGDWTPFLNGLDETIRKAREAYTAMDQLGNTKMSYGYINARNQADLQKQITILRDKDSTEAQKQAAKQALGGILKDQKEATERLKLESAKTMQALVAQGTGLSAPDVSLMSIDKTIRYDASAVGDEEKAQRAKEYAEFEAEAERIRKKYTEIEMIQVGGGITKSMIPQEIVDNEKVNKEMAPVLAKYQDAINYNTILVKRSDEWLQNLIRIDNEAFNAERSYESMVKAANRASQSTKPGSGAGKPTPPPSGSLGNIDAEISKLNKKLTEATTMEARAAVQATINELEQRKVNIKVVVDQEAFKIKHGEMKGGELAAPGSIYEALQNNAGNKKQGSFDLRKELPNMKLPKFKSPIKKDDINLNNEYAESLSSIGSIMGSLSGAFDESSASVLQYGASLIGTIAQAIPAILAMIPAKAADTEATNANTTANVANAGSKVLSAHAGIPFAGIALGIAGIASIAAAMASLPAFTTGGIYTGGTASGDKGLARLNKGEMILNDGQQANLFRLLNGGIPSADRVCASPQLANLSRLIAPSEGNQKIELAGSVIVKGQDLELSFKNRNRITGKIK